MSMDDGLNSRSRAIPAASLAQESSEASAWLPTKRLRHIASFHLRNFHPTSAPDNQTASLNPTQLHQFSLALSPSQNPRQTSSPCSVYLTDVSSPSVNADWEIDPRDISQPSSSTQSASSSGVLGQTKLDLGLWSTPDYSRPYGSEEARQPSWFLQWENTIDLGRLEKIPGGLTSAYTRKLPPNSLIVGLRQSVLSDGHQEPLQDQKKSDNTETSQRLNQVTAASQLSRRLANVKLDDTIDYYYIPTSGATAAQSSHLPGRSGSSKLRSSRISTDDAAALSDPDVTFTSTGSDVPDTDSESGGSEGGGHGGYDSETTYELSGDTQTARPGLNRRRSSNRTIRALKRDRSRRGRKKNPFSPQAHEGSKATSSPSEGKVDAQSDRRRKLQRWQLEREREREVLERSKRETRMLHSYDSDALESLVREQIACSEQMETGHKERLATSRGLSRRDNTVTLGRRSSRAHLRLSSLEEQVDSEAANLKDLQLTLRERREALVKRKTRLELVKRQMQEEASWQGAQKDELESLGLHLLKLDVDVHNRRASMLETVSQIYPIQLMSAADLLFSICGIALPNSPATALGESKGKLDEEDLAAALGLTAQAVSLISSYLETPLHYEIATAGSRAMMRDGISLMTGPRGFPLYSKGVEQYRFEYGVFLLNKDIEQLMNVHGLPVLDLRHLLPNLNNLLLTLSSPATRASEALSGISNSVLAGTSPISSAKRKGYRTAGKGEIVLPSSTQQAVAPTIPENKVKDGVILQGPGVDAVKRTAEPSQAASWTASLLGWGGAGGRKTTPRRAGETETGKADVQNGSRASTAHVS